MAIVVFERDQLVENELLEVKNLVASFVKGDTSPEAFRPRRLLQGTYGQRQPGVQMVRIKIPAGNANRKQVLAMADCAEKYSHGILHITTRQDIQLHFIKTADIPAMLDDLAHAGLTTREACGNSFRNVTASPFSGSLRNEVFDVSPAAEEITRFFLRHKDTQALPRKFKVALSESIEDYGVTGMHDLGAIAKVQNGVPGFKVVVGGGLGSQPFPAEVYSDFISVNDLLLHCLAIARIFNKNGDRKKRMKARIKFLVQNWGIEKFKEECKKEIELIKAEGIQCPPVTAVIEKTEDFAYENPFDKASESEKYNWFQKNVYPTKRKNEWMVMVHIPLGDMSPDQTRKLAAKLTECQQGYGRDDFFTYTDDQNLLLKGIVIDEHERKKRFADIHDFLLSIELGMIGAHDGGDPVSCPGTSSCNLGITHSKGLARAIRSRFKNKLVLDERFEGTTIQMSGCPNSCGRHHIGTFGFFGRSDQLDENNQAPAYNVMIGGANLGDGKIAIAKRCGKILAKRVPDFMQLVMDNYEKERQPNESFVKYCARLEKERINSLIESFDKEKKPVTNEEKVNFDWDENKPYEVMFGEGECGV